MSFLGLLESVLCRFRGLQQRLFGSRLTVIRPTASIHKTREEPQKRNEKAPLASLCASLGLYRHDLQKPFSPFIILPSALKFRQPHGLSLLVQRSISWNRPLNLIEDELLTRSVLLPSVIHSIKRTFAQEALNEEPRATSAMLMRELASGEIPTSAPHDFAASLEVMHARINERMTDLKRFCRRLANSNFSVSLAYADGKVSVCTPNEHLMSEVVLPAAKDCVPWNDSWNVTLLMQPSDSNLDSNCFDLLDMQQHETSKTSLPISNDFASLQKSESTFFDCALSESSFSIVTARDLFPDASPDELEAFTAWSDA